MKAKPMGTRSQISVALFGSAWYQLEPKATMTAPPNRVAQAAVASCFFCSSSRRPMTPTTRNARFETMFQK
jgi:hypothetical protein